MSSQDFNQKLIENNILIARVITQASTLEGIIDAYISEFYTHCPKADYEAQYLALIYDVLNQRGVSIGTKVDILFKIFERLDKKKLKSVKRTDFDEWISIRNKMTHGKIFHDEDGPKLFFNGKHYEINSLA